MVRPNRKPDCAYLIGIIVECPNMAKTNPSKRSMLLGRKHIEVSVWSDKDGDSGFELEFDCPQCHEHHYVAFESGDWI
jgi:hypothetical protein